VAEGTSPEQKDLVDVFYAPFVRPLGNLTVLFAQAEAALLEFAAELTGETEKDAQRFLQMKAADAKREIMPLAQASGIEGFDLEELSEKIESYCCDRERRNRLIHDDGMSICSMTNEQRQELGDCREKRTSLQFGAVQRQMMFGG
jgi:hypothetical protein